MSSAFSRPNWATIDLDALRHNVAVLARYIAPSRLVAVIKAGAYGHGAVEVARAIQFLPEVALLGVASVDEARCLCESGVEKPIILFSAILEEEAPQVVRLDLIPTVWTPALAHALNAAAHHQNRRLTVHFKVDTGMGRLGARWEEAACAYQQVTSFPFLDVAGVYTHFACADEDSDYNDLQWQRFEEFCARIGASPSPLRHAANSAAALRFPAARYDLCRFGIALYGVHPCPHLSPSLDLRPVMTWQARVTALKVIEKGESVSYSATWRAPRRSKIAVLPVGYADGYLRALSNRGQVLIGGKLAPVVGRVTMDQIMVDVTEIPTQIGDVATIWGQGLPVEDVAARADTIAYELLCAVAARVPRIYQGQRQVTEITV